MIPLHLGKNREITAALIERIAGERHGSGFDQILEAPVEILIPSRGFGDSIVGALIARFPQGVAGIRLQTPESLALRILNRAGRYPRVASAEDRSLLMLLAAKGLQDPRLATPGIAAMLERSYRDIRDSGVTLSSFRRGRESFTHPERSAEIMDCFRRYEQSLARTAAIDPADAFHQAIEGLNSDSDLTPQIIFGFYDMTGIQEMFLAALHRAGKIDSVYVPVVPADPAYSFASRHLSELNNLPLSPSPLLPVSPSPPLWSVAKYQTPADEARETLRAARALIDRGINPGRIGVVTRTLESDRVALLRRAAAQFDLSISAPSNRPLVSHRFGRTVRLLLEVREHRFPRSMVIELASGPLRRDFWEISFNPERLDSETRRVEIAGGPSAWVKASLPRIEAEHPHSLEHVTNYLKLLHRLEQFTEPLATSRRGARWADTLEGIAGLLYAETEEDLAALSAVRELASICRQADSSGTAFDAATVVRLMESADSLPAAIATGPSIWVGDVMKARGRSFHHLFLIDFRDGVFPQARMEDPLVPNADRRRCDVRQIGDGRDEERLLFQLLLDAVESEIHFSFAVSDGVRRVFHPSHFLKDFAQRNEPDGILRKLAIRDFAAYVDHAQVSSRAKRGIWVEEEKAATQIPRFARDDTVPHAKAPSTRVEKRIDALSKDGVTEAMGRRFDIIRLAGSRSRFDSYLTGSEALREALDKRLALISPSSLEHYGQCPQRFLFNALLGVGEIEDPEYELQISLRKKGGLDHRILESFYRSLTDADFAAAADGNLPESLQQRLEATIDEQFRKHEFEYPAPNQMIREVERKLTRRFLSEFVREDLKDLVASGFRPRFFEYQFGPGRGEKEPDHAAVPIALGSRSVTVRGKIDRVDRHLDGNAYRVLDYKSGKGLRYRKLAELIESGRALQLAFYALAAGEIFGVPPENIHAAIRPFRHGEADEELAFSLADVNETLTTTLAQLGESMSASHFPALPGRHCDYCAVSRWCRARNDPSEKQSLSAFKSAVDLLKDGPRSPVPGPQSVTVSTGDRGPGTGDLQEK